MLYNIFIHRINKPHPAGYFCSASVSKNPCLRSKFGPTAGGYMARTAFRDPAGFDCVDCLSI